MEATATCGFSLGRMINVHNAWSIKISDFKVQYSDLLCRKIVVMLRRENHVAMLHKFQKANLTFVLVLN